MVTSVWNSFLKVLQTQTRRDKSFQRRRAQARLGNIEQVEERVLLAGNLALTDAYLVDVNGVALPTGTVPVVGEAIYVRVDWTESGVALSDQYRLGFRLNQFTNLGAPAGGFFSGQNTNASHSFYQFAGYALPGVNAVEVIVDYDPQNLLNGNVSETNDNDNDEIFGFISDDLADPLSPSSLPELMVTPVTGVAAQDWWVSYNDADPRPNTTTNFFEDYIGGKATSDGQFGYRYQTTNFDNMDRGRVTAVAVASGTVTQVVDGQFDRQTGGGTGDGNYVRISLGNGWEVLYSNLMNGTITVEVGDNVEANDVLGLLGSSGDGTRTQMTWRLYHNGSIVEPGYAPSTYFINPLVHSFNAPFRAVDSGITNVDPAADFLERPQNYTTFSNSTSSTQAWLWFQPNRQLQTEPMVIRWLRPDNSVALTTTVTPSAPSLGAYVAASLDNSIYRTVLGTWQATVTVGGTEVLRRSFTVAATAGAPEVRVQQETSSNPIYILSERTTPVDFGTFNPGDPLHTVLFTVQNTGASTLNLSNFNVPTGFALHSSSSFPTSIAPGASGQFRIQLDSPQSVNHLFRGQQFGDLTFTTNDPDEPRVRFPLNGFINITPFAGPDVDIPGPALPYQFQMLPQVISPDAQLVSVGSGLGASSTLHVAFASGGRSEDVLGVRHQGTSAGLIGVAGSNLTFGGTSIGTFTVTNDPISGGRQLDVDFNGNVTQAAVTALMQNITYVNTSVVPNTHPRYVQFVVYDNDGDRSDLPFKVIDVIPDTHPVEVTLSITPVTTPGALTQDFQLIYTDAVSVDGSTPNASDIVSIIGPDGTLYFPQFGIQDSLANGVQRSTTWTLPGPGGFWDIRDNGTYQVRLAPLEVRDINGNVSPGEIIGSFVINVPNQLPSFTNLVAGQSTLEDTPTAIIPLSVTDLETAPAALQLTASSDNLTLIAANGYSFAGSGANRTLVITPIANAFGAATITVQVTDQHGGITPLTFQLLVQSVNDLPVISVIPNQDIQQDTSTAPVAFTISDIETAAGSLIVGATSSDPLLIKNSNIVVGGTPGNPTLVVTPEPGRFGRANITVTVTDANSGFTTRVFEVLVRENSQPPVITPNQIFSVPENSAATTPVGTVLATDPDAGQTLSYAITQGNVNNAFVINASTGAITVLTPAALDFETVTQFTLTVAVTDNSFPGVTSTSTVLVNVTNVNEAPVVPNRTLNINENPPNGQALVVMTATDVDAGQTRLFSIFSGNPNNNGFVIDPVTGVLSVNNSASISFEASPIITLTIAATDNGAPAATGFGTVTINLGNINEPPTINPQTLQVPENSINGTNVGTVVASDQDSGQSLQYTIVSGNADGAFAIHPVSGLVTVANSTLLDFETQPVRALVIQVTDNASPALSASATVTINVTDVNEPPTIAPQSFSINENSSNGSPVGIVLTGNPEGSQSITYSISSGNTGGAFQINPTTGQLSVANSAALSFETNPQFQLTIQASDNGSPVQTSSGTVTVNLNDVNESPLLLDQVFTPNENLAVGASAGTVVASDPDSGQVLTFAITASSIPGVFSINPQSGVISVVNAAAVNFETNPVITLTVTATDNAGVPLTTQATITVNLQNVNDLPIVPNQTLTFAENQTAGFFVTLANATDEDLPAQSLTYSIIGGNTGGAFTIDPTTGQITVANAAAVDFETSPQFQLQVQARDNGAPPRSGVGIVTINLTDVNEPPIVPTQQMVVPENSAVGFVVGTVQVNNPELSQILTYELLSGNELGAFTLDAVTGQIRVANPALLNFETPLTFVLDIQVTDNGVPTLSRTGQVTITVGDVNEFPVFAAPYVFTINENLTNGTALGTIQATDPDLGQTLQYAIVGGNQGNAFVLNQNTGVLSVGQSSLLDFETTPSFTLTIQALDSGNPRRVTNNTVTINLQNVNDAPKIIPQSFQIDENAPNTTVVGTVLATDADAGQSVSFQIQSGNESGALAIDSSSGVLTVVNSSALDFESRSVFNLIIRVTDTASPTPASSTANVMVSLRNLNEPPIMLPQTFSVPENRTQGTLVGTVLAVDGEPGQTVLFSIESGNTNGAFAINANTGVLTIANPAMFDFETQPTFNLVIRATDNANPPLSRTATMTINVLNLNELPQIGNQIFTIDENTANGTVVGTVSATDPDGPAGLVYSITSGNVGNAFSINASTGVLTVNDRTALNFELRQVLVLGVQVTDPHSATATASVTVNLTNVNDAPLLSDATFSVAENSIVGSLLGTVLGIEQDPGQSITYSIVSGNTNGAFTIHPTTGKLTVANPGALDFETNPVFTLGVRAQDNGSPSESTTVTATVNLTNVDEPLSIEFNPEQTFVQEGQKQAVIDGGAIVRDADTPDTTLVGVTLTVSLSSDTSNRADRLEILTGANGLTIKGKSLMSGGVKVGTIAGGRRGTPLFVNFTAEATLDTLQTIVRSTAVSLRGKHTFETIDVKFRLSGTPGSNGGPSVKTLTFIQPFQVVASATARRKNR